jgi:hypothetical protein
MSEEDWFDNPDEWDDHLEEEIDCDYGLSEYCEDPFLRSSGCCFECDLYLKACETQRESADSDTKRRD